MQMNKLSLKALAALAAGALAANVQGLTTPTVDYTTYVEKPQPQGVLTTLVKGPDTRGFSWITDTSVTESKVWLLKGAYTAADDAKFASEGTLYTGECKNTPWPTTVNSHLVKVYGLTEAGTYSYRLGGGDKFAYGQFEVKSAPADNAFTVLNLNDAQTRHFKLLYVWENTVAQAKGLTDGNVDFILYGGDYLDVSPDASNLSGKRLLEWGIAADCSVPYFPKTPWVMASGNHDYQVFAYTMPVDYAYTNNAILAGTPIVGCTSFDYGKVHFAVLPCLNTGSWNSYYAETLAWLEQDLQKAKAAKDAKTIDWIVISDHFSPYTTGDHCVSGDALAERLAPICAKYEVDLFLQAHDHTYSKSLPYRWDGPGLTTSNDRTSEDVKKAVNLNPKTTVVGGETYDLDPNGTYYVSCATAGERNNEAPTWADVNGSNSYANKRKYKLITGKVNVNSTCVYEGVDYGRKIGDDASHDHRASMFGVLKFKGDTMSYDFYIVNMDGTTAPVLYDTLKVKKTLAPPAFDAGTMVFVR